MPSDSSPSASLMAATWPGVSGVGTGRLMEKLRDAVRVGRLNWMATCASRTDVAGLVGVEALDVDADGGVGIQS